MKKIQAYFGGGFCFYYEVGEEGIKSISDNGDGTFSIETAEGNFIMIKPVAYIINI